VGTTYVLKFMHGNAQRPKNEIPEIRKHLTFLELEGKDFFLIPKLPSSSKEQNT